MTAKPTCKIACRRGQNRRSIAGLLERIFIPFLVLTAGVAPTVLANSQTTRGSADIPALIQALGDPD